MNRQTILVTGGAGFIGSNLIEKFLDKYCVICVDNFNDYYDPNWKRDNVREFLDKENFTLYKTDFVDLENLKQIFVNHKIDKIVHLGARAGVRPSIANPLLYEEVNVRGTLNVLEMARQFAVKQFVFASSSSVYGDQEKIPFSETDPVNNPVSPYAATKKSGEMLAYAYSHLYKIKTTCLRFFTVYGPKGRPDMAPYLFTKAILNGEEIKKFGNGKTKRDYTYVDDIVSGIEKAIKNEFDFEIINLGNNNPVELNYFISILESIIGKKALIKQMPMQAGDVTKTYADISKAKKLLNWEPKVGFEDGLRKFVDWYKQERLLS